MLDVRQVVLLLSSFILFQQHGNIPPAQQVTHVTKSVAVVGAGSAGLAMLRVLVDLQDELQGNLDIVMYEQRQDVGGIWLPDSQPVLPPTLPETPLYPLLHTNTPIPTMTYPGFPFPPGTPLFSSHEHIERYHQDFAQEYNLLPHIFFNHTVTSASWVGSPEKGYWDVRVVDHGGHEMRRSFDHLVVANGHNHYPHSPTFRGQDEWLRKRSHREIIHSMFFREPQRYINQTVVVVGSGASGRDTASQISLYAGKVYLSIRSQPNEPVSVPVEIKPQIAHFTSDVIVFTDGSCIHDADAVILATGYDLRIPFLEASGEVALKPKSSERAERGLVTNQRYLFPLHQHIFSLSGSYPTNALAFIGLPILVSNCPSDAAQSIYAARAIANASLLDSREELLRELDSEEDSLRSRGYDPYYIGHRMVDGLRFDYQDNLIDRLKRQGAMPDDGVKYVEAWRREVGRYQHLKRGWRRVEELGLQRQWLRGVETETEWADMMRRLNEWQKEWEEKQGLSFPGGATIF